jgi:hypothetical protein
MSRLKVLALLAAASIVPLSSPSLHAQAARQFTSGTTTLVLNGEFVSAITADGVTPTPAYPGTLSGTTATFPIVTGGIDLDTAAAAIYHSGGLTFTSTSAGKTVTISQFGLTTEGSAGTFLLGLVTVNNSITGLYPLFSITGRVTPPLSGPAVNVPNLTVSVTGQLASLLNQAFGVTGFSEGDIVGVIDVQGTVADFGTTGAELHPAAPVR